MVSNEMLFYGGLAAAVLMIILFIIFLVIFRIGKLKLDYRYDEEYGKADKE